MFLSKKEADFGEYFSTSTNQEYILENQKFFQKIYLKLKYFLSFEIFK